MKRLLLLVLLAGCNERFIRANELASSGRYLEAAEQFEVLSREEPHNRELKQLTERARQRAVDQALGEARRLRLAGAFHDSHRAFAQGLGLRQRWDVRLDGALEGTVNDEREDLQRWLRERARPHAQNGEALALLALYDDHRFILEHRELRVQRDELLRQALETGQSSCARLHRSAGAEKPYFSSLVSRYCATFRAEGPREWPLADTVSAVKLQVNLTGLPPGVSGAAEASTSEAFLKSPWFDGHGLGSADLSLSGSASQTDRQQTVTRAAGWVERVPYTVNVTRLLTEEVPVTGCEAYSESDGKGALVSKVREVTKKKTKTREVVVQETHWREVQRTFSWQAERLERTLAFSVRASASSSGTALGGAGRETTGSEAGYSHDTRFEPANVAPERPRFSDPQAWFESRSRELGTQLESALAESWRARFCAAPALSLESASRCMRVGSGVPAAAIDALRAELRGDAPYAPGLFRTAGPAATAHAPGSGPPPAL